MNFSTSARRTSQRRLSITILPLLLPTRHPHHHQDIMENYKSLGLCRGEHSSSISQVSLTHPQLEKKNLNFACITQSQLNMVLAWEHHMYSRGNWAVLCTGTQLQMMQLAHSNTPARTEFTCYLGFKRRFSWEELIHLTCFHADSSSDTTTPRRTRVFTDSFQQIQLQQRACWNRRGMQREKSQIASLAALLYLPVPGKLLIDNRDSFISPTFPSLISERFIHLSHFFFSWITQNTD